MKPKLALSITLLFLLAVLDRTNSNAVTRQHIVFKYPCPEKCVCVSDTHDFNLMVFACIWPHLQPQFIANFPANVTKSIDIQCTGGNNQKSSLGSASFVGFTELRVLKISDCALDALPADTFAGLDSLNVLSLDRVHAPQLDASVFARTPQVESLSLTRSRGTRIPAGTLCPLKRLQILNLSDNQLSSIRLGTNADECRLEQLYSLDVAYNRIRHLSADDLRAFSNLRHLSMAGNYMDDVEVNAFQATPMIENLNLESNLLRTAPSLPDSVQHLNMADNRLENLPATVANLENLVSLNLSHNEIDLQTPFALFTTHLDVLDLSNNRFNAIPQRLFVKSVDVLKQLWMAGNRLQEIEPQFFANFTNLQTLDLSKNHLKSLSEGFFDGLLELNELRLANNLIYHVDIEAFRPLGRQLQLLDMSGNQLAELPMAVGRLSRAKHLNFAHNRISKTYKFNLNKITHLNRLDLSDNSLEAVESYVFADCPYLSDLNLRNNRLRELSRDAFQKCPQLRIVDLSQNLLEGLDGALKDLRSLRYLNLTHNSLKMLDFAELPDDLVSLSVVGNKVALLGVKGNSRLRRLELQHNQISLLIADQLPATLEHLNISHNHLQQINDGTFAAMRQLKFVDLRSNRLVTISGESFASSTPGSATIVRLYLSDNPLQCSCKTEWLRYASAKNSSPIQLYDFNHVKCQPTIGDGAAASSARGFLTLAQTVPQDFVCEYKDEICEPQCVCCQFASCDCKSRCPRDCQCFYDSTFRLNIVHCEGQSDGTSKERSFEVRDLPMHATHIRLRRLSLHTLQRHDFTVRARLVELELNGTGLRHIEPMALNTLQSLKTLIITNNHLHKLNGSEFVKTQNLQRLDLSNNRFSALDAQPLAKMFPALEELRLNGNAFTDLPRVVEEWPADRLQRLFLGTNPFRCDCYSQPDRFRAQNWIRHHSDMVVDLKQVVCVENVTRALRTNDTALFSDQMPNEGDDLFVMPMHEFFQQVNRSFCTPVEYGLFSSDPVWNSLLILVLCVLTAALLLVTIWGAGISLIRRSRHSMKNPRYRKATNSSSLLNAGNSASQGSSPQPLNKYDIFLSYSKVDADAVQRELCIPLQNQYLSMLKLHPDTDDYRNNYTKNGLQCVSDELISKMRSCNTLVWYLSRNFVNDEWTSVAIKTAHRLIVQNRYHKVIVLLASDLNTNELDTELGQMLRRNIDIIHKNNQLWWNFLINALPRRPFDHSGDGTLGGVDMGQDNDSETTQIYSDMYGTIVPSEVV